jgi:hypothetical protein
MKQIHLTEQNSPNRSKLTVYYSGRDSKTDVGVELNGHVNFVRLTKLQLVSLRNWLNKHLEAERNLVNGNSGSLTSND